MGEVGLRSSNRAEISYAVDVALWGHGIGSAIGALLVSWAFDNLEAERVEATCDPRNIASGKVLRRIGDHWTAGLSLFLVPECEARGGVDEHFDEPSTKLRRFRVVGVPVRVEHGYAHCSDFCCCQSSPPWCLV